MNPKKNYSTGDAAEILGVHVDTVRRFCDNGDLAFEKGLLSTHRRIRPESLEAFMLKRGVCIEVISKVFKGDLTPPKGRLGDAGDLTPL